MDFETKVAGMEATAAIINQRQPFRKAFVENTGGWNMCIIMNAYWPKDYLWYFGTANECWGGSLSDPDGEYCELEANTTIPSDEPIEPEELATAILEAVANKVVRV